MGVSGRKRQGKAKTKGNDAYSIGELARQADVTPRTVRFYVAEGLLPPPVGSGRAATYTAEHVSRLTLIKLLKDEFLPLAEIRDLLTGLSQAEIEDLLAQKRRPVLPPSSDSAREYIQTLLQADSAAAGSPAMLRQAVARKKARAAAAPQAPVRAAEGGTTAAPGVEPTVTWGRISLHPDVELNVRHPPTDSRTPARVQQLLEAARRLFNP
jgi:DNA-binding transcriptional MerR regulator